MKNPPLPANVDQTYGDDNPGYFVFVEGGRSPTKKHPNRFLADIEARRLCAMLPGRTVHVLKPRATYVNGLEMPADTTRLNREERLAANAAKQLHARRGMEPGGIVRVKTGHHMHADELGYIERLGEGDDVTVYVKLMEGAGDIQRFSPTSLNLIEGRSKRPTEDMRSLGDILGDALRDKRRTYPGDGGLREQVRPLGAGPSMAEMMGLKAKRELRRGDIVAYMERGVERQGEIKRRLDVKGGDPLFLLRDNLVMPRGYSAGDLKLVTAIEDRPDNHKQSAEPKADRVPADIAKWVFDSLAAWATERNPAGPVNPEKQGTAIPLGTAVYVLANIPDHVGAAYPAKLASYDRDDRFVWVHMESPDGTFIEKATKVNQSRVIRQDDPAYRLMPA